MRGAAGVTEVGARWDSEPEGGAVEVDGDALRVEGADAVVLRLVCGSSSRDFQTTDADPARICMEHAGAIADTSYEALRYAHVADHRAYFDRVSIDLGSSGETHAFTDRRLKAFEEADDPELAAQFFQFGRYLMIAGSRPGTQPLNLQGVWNESQIGRASCRARVQISVGAVSLKKKK